MPQKPLSNYKKRLSPSKSKKSPDLTRIAPLIVLRLPSHSKTFRNVGRRMFHYPVAVAPSISRGPIRQTLILADKIPTTRKVQVDHDASLEKCSSRFLRATFCCLRRRRQRRSRRRASLGIGYVGVASFGLTVLTMACRHRQSLRLPSEPRRSPSASYTRKTIPRIRDSRLHHRPRPGAICRLRSSFT